MVKKLYVYLYNLILPILFCPTGNAGFGSFDLLGVVAASAAVNGGHHHHHHHHHAAPAAAVAAAAAAAAAAANASAVQDYPYT